jgi:hypothetical protein
MAGRTLPGAALKTAVWTRLKLALYPAATVQIGGLPDLARPCLVIGPSFWPDDSTGSTSGFDGEVQVHAWTPKDLGAGVCEALLSSALSALTDAELPEITVPGWSLVLLEISDGQAFADPSGDWHGVLTLRAQLDQI